MTKLAIARSTAILLLALNIFLIGFMYLNKPSRLIGPRNLIIEKLNFDSDQITAYDILIKNHQDKIELTEKKIAEIKNILYSTLNDDVTLEFKDTLISELSGFQSKIEDIHYEHFRDIKMLCKPEQISLFKDLTTELTDYFSPKIRRKR